MVSLSRPRLARRGRNATRGGCAEEEAQPKGGEALQEDGGIREPAHLESEPDSGPASTGFAWHALQARSHCEDLVCNRLTRPGMDVGTPGAPDSDISRNVVRRKLTASHPYGPR